MKKETSIILAGAVGFFAVLGFIGIRKFLNFKDKKYNEDYSDFHRHFDEENLGGDENHGIEFLAMI